MCTRRSHHLPLRGLLRVGVIPTIAAYLFPHVLPRVRRRHPELRLRLHEARTSELVALLRRGELDLLVVALEAPLEGDRKSTRLNSSPSCAPRMPSSA